MIRCLLPYMRVLMHLCAFIRKAYLRVIHVYFTIFCISKIYGIIIWQDTCCISIVTMFFDRKFGFNRSLATDMELNLDKPGLSRRKVKFYWRISLLPVRAIGLCGEANVTHSAPHVRACGLHEKRGVGERSIETATFVVSDREASLAYLSLRMPEGIGRYRDFPVNGSTCWCR